jgi:hypothetical protein
MQVGLKSHILYISILYILHIFCFKCPSKWASRVNVSDTENRTNMFLLLTGKIKNITIRRYPHTILFKSDEQFKAYVTFYHSVCSTNDYSLVSKMNF